VPELAGQQTNHVAGDLTNCHGHSDRVFTLSSSESAFYGVGFK